MKADVSATVTPLVCPLCGAGGLWASTSEMTCGTCAARYPVRAGVIDMLRLSDTIESERSGNRLMVVEERAAADPAWLLALPESFAAMEMRSGQVSHDALADMECAADVLDLRSKAVVVELGAGVCWTTWRLAKRGWCVAATDVSEEPYVGLSSGEVYMAEHGVRFDRVLHDMSGRWPYADCTVDGVVANCSIHHAQNLPIVFEEAFRVLRPGGRFAFVEATTGRVLRSDGDFGRYEKERYGWNEHLYPVVTYTRAAQRAGFAFRYSPAPSTIAKFDRASSGDRTVGSGVKYAAARIMGPILRTELVRSLVLGALYPIVNWLVGTQIVGIAEKPRGVGP